MTPKIIIPARLHSTRFPKKILADIHGKTLMEHTYRQALKSKLGEVWIAVDDPEVEKIARRFGAENICMTSQEHISGTSRLSEVCEKFKNNFNLDPNTIILNWQVDEPLLAINNAHQVVDLLNQKTDCQVATLCEPIELLEDLQNPNITKVVRDYKNRALYFSRAMIPWERGYFPDKKNQDKNFQGQHLRHIGLYAYRAKFLLDFNSMPDCPMETMEGLEQLRFLYAGYSIAVDIAKEPSFPGVDTPEDLIKISEFL